MRLAQVGVCRLMERNTVLLAPFPTSAATALKQAHDADSVADKIASWSDVN
jgi:hypothetical protein